MKHNFCYFKFACRKLALQLLGRVIFLDLIDVKKIICCSEAKEEGWKTVANCEAISSDHLHTLCDFGVNYTNLCFQCSFSCHLD